MRIRWDELCAIGYSSRGDAAESLRHTNDNFRFEELALLPGEMSVKFHDVARRSGKTEVNDLVNRIAGRARSSFRR
jgi:hypothetical protein